ncbi:STAS domain-containing protein [Cellulomonas massiliensis]|uniref:STAS domain-containing protein n=1 Tax=Cellulomonas massiliensis TaxID=1465811 RepID=UPI0002DF9DAD|nr:STAS domain-containing protein [Cellulomonas massiliensis]
MDDVVSTLTVERRADELRVVLVGDIDLRVRDEQGPRLWSALAEPGLARVVVDAGRVRFADSSGMSVLVRLVRDATEAGLGVEVLAWSDALCDALAVTGIDTWMREHGVRVPG